jgi:hypothetical protein
MNRLKSSTLILSVALALGIAWDVLFYSKPLGISLPLFVLLLLAALFGVARWAGTPPARRNLWLVIPLLFLAAMVFIHANPFLTFLNVAASLALLGLIAYFYAAGRVERTGLIEYPLLLLLAGGNALVRPAPLMSARIDWQTTREHSRRNVLPVARGCLLALPVLLVFTCLLASADLVFAKYVGDALRLQFLADALEWLWRGVLILAVAWVALGGLVYALARRLETEDKPGLVKGIEVLSRVVSLGFTETAIVLAGVDLLFLAFVWIQFVYLFGGQANIGVEGYTYAEYARRGFFELVAVSLLTQGLILSLHHVGRRKIAWQKYVFNGLSSLMVALVLIILASAFKRMMLYEAAYGYTRLRLYSHIFEVWLAFTFAWFLITLWLRPDRFALGAFVAAVGFLVTLNLVNPDAFIARQNLARYEATGKLDVYYLTWLSDDALPVLVDSAGQLADEQRRTLEDHLRARLSRMQEDAGWRRWPAFHLARWRAYRVLEEWKDG